MDKDLAAGLAKLSASEAPAVLRAELAALRSKLSSSEAAVRSAEADRQRLTQQVVTLEADRRALHQESENRRLRCLELEQACAALTRREDEALGQLCEAQGRERELAVKGVESRIACSQAESLQMQALVQARSHQWDVQRLERELVISQQEAEALRDELQGARSQGGTSGALLDKLQTEHTTLAADHKEQRKALNNVEEIRGALESRVSGLEEALRVLTAERTESAAEVSAARTRCSRLEEANRRLRLDLQGAIDQAVRASEIPFYGGAKDLDFSIQPRSPTSPLSTAPAAAAAAALRIEYPKSALSRQLREKVLNTRCEALNRIESLRDAPVF